MSTYDVFQNKAKYSDSFGPILESAHEQHFTTSFFYGPHQKPMNSRETFPVNPVSFWWGPR